MDLNPRGQPSASHLPPIGQGETPASLLNSPVEIILLIGEQLVGTPASFFALTLTCKTLHNILISRAPVLEVRDRKHLFVLLEEEPRVGNQFYFCSSKTCKKLHRFSPSWSPLTHERTPHSIQGNHRSSHPADFPCNSAQFPRSDGAYKLSFGLARLVMNRHHYGEPVGLPLSVLNATSVKQDVWTQSWSARIIDDELFLSATHTIDSCSLGGDPSLRSAIDQSGEYSICPHVYPSTTIDALKRPQNTSNLFRECQDVHGSCIRCHTDYTTTIERKRNPKRFSSSWSGRHTVNTGWVITIVSYYHIESCSSIYERGWNLTIGKIGMAPSVWWNYRNGFRAGPRELGSVRDIWLRRQTC